MWDENIHRLFYMIQFDKFFCTGEGVVRPIMNPKENFVQMLNWTTKLQIIFSLKNKLVVLKHMVSLPINNLKAILKNGVYLQKYS